MRGLALGGFGPGWAGGAVEGGELFDVVGNIGHRLTIKAYSGHHYLYF